MVVLGTCDEVEEELLRAFCIPAAKAAHHDAAALKAIDAAALKAANAHEGVVGVADDSDDDDDALGDGGEGQAEPSMFGAPSTAAAAEAEAFAKKAAVDGGEASLDDFLDALEST